VCHRMLDCGHVFCRQCLQDFYNTAITEGGITSVRCLAPDCAKNRNADRKVSGKKGKTKTNINPSELLKIPLELDVVKRYVKLKRKAELESDKNTIYCPRTWCQGAARSRKHRKPSQPMENIESSDEETDQETGQEPVKKVNPRRELLSICEDCSFAFCSRCYQGWHGEFTVCSPRTNTGELTEEDKASIEYLKLHTTPCPTCAAPAQKTHGCNHMICSRCNTHFCYLCSAWLQPENPYQHYNLETTSCFNRLWELEAGDGDDVGIGFAGGVQAREQAIRAVELVDILEERNALGENGNIGLEGPAAPPQVVPLAGPFTREGPLVLRIGQLPPRPAPQPALQPPAAQRNRRQPRQVGRRREPTAQPPALHVDEGMQPAPVHLARRANQHVPRPPAPRQGARAGAVGAVNRAGPANEDLQEAAHRAWIMNFVQMALNDEEDLVEWDSDDEEDHGAWVIPVR
jgi:E3 ubiquitin-protein ligase RNF14